MTLTDDARIQRVERSFRHLRRKGVANADVEMFLAVIAGLGPDRLTEALKNGADPNRTDAAVLDRFERMFADLEPAPWTRARRRATAAAHRLRRCFVRSGLFAYSPLTAFLVVAALGMWVGPQDLLGLFLWGVLVAAPLATILVAWHRRARFGQLALVGGGSSLAWFTAAYLLTNWLDDQSILRTGGVPIDLIGEAAFLSLTIGITGGTIGIELNGLARVAAFLQILFSLSFAVIVVSHAWRVLATFSGRPGRP